MKMVDYFADHVDDEVCSAVKYAEKYIEYKNTRPNWARLFHDMALQELTHAANFKEMGETAIEEIKSTYLSSEDMQRWTECLNHYADKMTMAKMMMN